MTTYELPPEPPTGTRVTDKYGDTWERVLKDGEWERARDGRRKTWGGVLAQYSPLTEVPAPALPTEDGANRTEDYADAVLALLGGEER